MPLLSTILWIPLAGAVCFWRPMEPSQDGFAEDGLKFLKELFSN